MIALFILIGLGAWQTVSVRVIDEEEEEELTRKLYEEEERRRMGGGDDHDLNDIVSFVVLYFSYDILYTLHYYLLFWNHVIFYLYSS